MEMRYTFGGFLFLSLICYHDVEFISYFINIIYRICKKKKNPNGIFIGVIVYIAL